MALSCRAGRKLSRQLSAVKRTPSVRTVAAAFDPKQTLDGRRGNLGTWPGDRTLVCTPADCPVAALRDLCKVAALRAATFRDWQGAAA
jgi:hypothetical protein